MTSLILVRHGETDWNRELRFQGQIDVPLNAVGQAQSQRLAQRLAGEAVHQVIASDLLRAQQTALPVDAQLAVQPGTPLATLAGLREQNFGAVDGMRVADIQSRYAEDWAQWIRFDADYAFPRAESPRAFHTRVMGALAELVARQDGGHTLVVVTHGGVLDMVYRTARGLPLSGPRQAVIPNAGINRVRVLGEGEGLRFEIDDWADTRHLQDLPAQPVYDQARLAQAAAWDIPSAPL